MKKTLMKEVLIFIDVVVDMANMIEEEWFQFIKQ